MHPRWTWLAGSVRERETHARSDNSFSENDTSITRRGAAITISPSVNPPKGDMDIVKPKGNPPMRADSWNRYTRAGAQTAPPYLGSFPNFEGQLTPQQLPGDVDVALK